MIKLIDLECLRPITFLCVLTGHAPPEQISLCTSHSNNFHNAMLRSLKRPSLVYSRLLSVALISWSSYQLIVGVVKLKQYSYCCLIVMFTLPQLVMFAKLWLNGSNREMQQIFSKLTEVDHLLHMARRTGVVQTCFTWVKRSYRYAAFIVLFYLLNSMVYVYTILQFVNSQYRITDGVIVLILHSQSSVLLLEFVSLLRLLRNRFVALNSLIGFMSEEHLKIYSLKADSGQLSQRLPRSLEGDWSKLTNVKRSRILPSKELYTPVKETSVIESELEDSLKRSRCTSGISNELLSTKYQKHSAPNCPYRVVADSGYRLYDCDPHIHIQKLRLAHHTLHEISNLINRRYSVLLLSEICAVFVVFLTCAHVVFNYQSLSYMNGPQTIQSMITWIAVTTTRVLLVIFTCRGVTEEATRTVHLVTTPRADPGVQSLWDTFSLQLVHFRRVEFDAGSVFQIRLQLLFNIVGATATYLIVLQQYKDIKV